MRGFRRLAATTAAAMILTACGAVEEVADVVEEAASQPSGGDASSADEPAAPSASGSVVDGDFAWTAVEFGCDFVDDVEARGRVTNNGPDISSAAFTITVLQGGGIAATLTGFVDDLASGATKTVEFISLDDCLQGEFTYEIQTDFSLEGSGGMGSGGASGNAGDFTWDAVDFGCDFVDDVEARGRVTNNGGDVSTASFTITLFQDGAIVATLTGFVDGLASGQTKTVEFISLDDCFDGDFTYDIQTDFAM